MGWRRSHAPKQIEEGSFNGPGSFLRLHCAEITSRQLNHTPVQWLGDDRVHSANYEDSPPEQPEPIHRAVGPSCKSGLGMGGSGLAGSPGADLLAARAQNNRRSCSIRENAADVCVFGHIERWQWHNVVRSAQTLTHPGAFRR